MIPFQTISKAVLLGSVVVASPFGGQVFAQDAQGQIVLGASHSLRYGSAVDLSVQGTDLGGYGINAGVAVKKGDNGQQLSFNIEKQIDLGDTQLGTDTQVFLGFFGQKNEWDADTFDSENIGVEAKMSAGIAPNLRYSAGLFWQQDKLDNFDDGTSAILTADEGETFASGVLLGLAWDTYSERSPLSIGTRIGANIRMAGLGGDREFTSVTLSAKTTQPLARSMVFNLGLKAGNITGGDGVNVVDRAFSAGGGPRGFAFGGITPRDSATDNALGGTQYVSALAEILAPVGNRGIALGAFYDVGSVWSLPDISSPTVDDGFHLRTSAGLTMKWQTNFGYLDISLAAPIEYLDSDEKQTFSISFGSEF